MGVDIDTQGAYIDLHQARQQRDNTMYICHFPSFGQYQGGFATREQAEAYGKAAGAEFKVWTRRQFFNR